MIGLYRIHGDSMSPSLLTGDYVVTWRMQASRLLEGQVVVVDHPTLGRIVKRIHALLANQQVLLIGDNRRQSTETEVIGHVDAHRVLGKMVWRIAMPTGRASARS